MLVWVPPESPGARRHRRAQDAIAEIHLLASRSIGYEWVLDADIAACFDEISHTALMGRLRARIKDKRICALVKAFLKAGVMTSAGREESPAGTPQGGILSPLLANIALSALDEHIARQWEPVGWKRQARRRQGLGNWKLIRYADDFVIMVYGKRHHAEGLRAEVADVLKPLGLRLSPEKTRIVHIDEGFEFLGFHIQRRRKRGTDEQYIYTIPSKKAVQAIRDKVRRQTHRSARNTPTDIMIGKVDRMVRGWANYFRHGVSKAVFNTLDNYVWWRLTQWIRRKHSRIPLKQIRQRFCDEGWRLTHNGVTYHGASSVAIVRYRYRGSKIPAPWTPKPESPQT